MDCRDIEFGFAYQRDAEKLAQMSRDLVEAGLGWSYQAHRVADLIADPETVALVARDGSRPVGFGIMKYGDERAHLVLLAVSPTHQRRGIARCTIAWLVESAKIAGMASVHVELRAPRRVGWLRSLDRLPRCPVPSARSRWRVSVRMHGCARDRTSARSR